MITLRKASDHYRARTSPSFAYLKRQRRQSCPECRPGQAPGPQIRQTSGWCPICSRVWRYFATISGKMVKALWYHELPTERTYPH